MIFVFERTIIKTAIFENNCVYLKKRNILIKIILKNNFYDVGFVFNRNLSLVLRCKTWHALYLLFSY